MNVLNLKTKTGKPFIEVKSSGAVVAWMNEHVKSMTEPEFYLWLTELLYYKVNDEQMADIKERAIKQPLSIPPDFLFLMEITVYEMFQVLRTEIEKHVDVNKIRDEAHLKKMELEKRRTFIGTLSGKERHEYFVGNFLSNLNQNAQKQTDVEE